MKLVAGTIPLLGAAPACSSLRFFSVLADVDHEGKSLQGTREEYPGHFPRISFTRKEEHTRVRSKLPVTGCIGILSGIGGSNSFSPSVFGIHLETLHSLSATLYARSFLFWLLSPTIQLYKAC